MTINLSMISYLKQLSYYQLLFYSTLLSILFSIFELLPNNPINSDGMWYIYIAQIYWKSGWSAAISLYPWPFLSALVAWVSHLSSLNILWTFHAINIVCQALIVISFIKCVKDLRGNANCQRWAALVILIYPYLNSIRMSVTRDFGYWGFGLLAISFLIQFMQNALWRYALAWGICMLIATLFRVEGLLMLGIAPLILWIQPHHSWKQKCINFMTANVFLFLGLIIGILWHFMHPNTIHWGRLNELYEQGTQIIPKTIKHLQQDAEKIRIAILNNLSAGNEMSILLGGLLMVYLLKVVSVFKPLYLILACYGQAKKLILNTHGEVFLLIWLIFFNALLLGIFILERYFSAPRYPVFMILLWMLWIPFTLEYLQHHTLWLWKLILMLLIVMGLAGLIRFGYSKTYLIEGSEWIKQSLPLNAKIYTNSREIRFYGSDYYTIEMRVNNITQIDPGTMTTWHPCDYDWLALRANHYGPLDLMTQQFISTHTPVKVFANNRQDKVLIYQTKNFCKSI